MCAGGSCCSLPLCSLWCWGTWGSCVRTGGATFWPLAFLGGLQRDLYCEWVWHFERESCRVTRRLDECLPLPRLYVPAYLETNPMAFGLVLGTKFLVYITALCLYVPAGTLVHYQWMNLTLVAALFIFYKTWKSDPGHILKCTNPSEAHRVSQPCGYHSSLTWWVCVYSVCVCVCV